MSLSETPHINLDYTAGTPLLPEVTQTVQQALDKGNPSSIHQAGQRAKQRLELDAGEENRGPVLFP